MLTEVVRWDENTNLPNYSFHYWNDKTKESGKEWNILDSDADAEQLIRYLSKSGLKQQYLIAESLLSDQYKNSSELTLCDLACGTGWTSALLSRLPLIKKVYAIEFSWHRLQDLFPETCIALNGVEEKIQRCYGSFYDLQLEDQSVDIIFMSQAFHHAEKPLSLITECERVLVPGGTVALIGEHSIGVLRLIKRHVKLFLKLRTFTPKRLSDLLPPDNILGDNYYPEFLYNFMWEQSGFSLLKSQKTDDGASVYVYKKLPA